MRDLKTIQHPVKQEMLEFQKRFKTSVKSEVSLLNIISSYVLKTKGKQMRPLFVFLSAKMLGEVSESTYSAATLMELMHTATLIHDDVVDESYERRGKFSINALWKSKYSVLLGDFYLAKGLSLAVANKDFEILENISNTVQEMSEGELLQLQKSRSLNITLDSYYEVIRKKTASLIATCVSCGALSVGCEKSVIDKVYDMGINIGMAFQIKDDLLDYQPRGIIGKPTGNDLKEKKFTLPLIYALGKADAHEKKKVLRKFRNGSMNADKINFITDFVNTHKGLDFAEEKMNYFKEKAREILHEFEPSDASRAMDDLICFTVERNK